MNKLKIILIGTSKFAYYQFKKIIKYKNNYKIICIITKKNNNIIKYLSINKKINLFEIKNKNEINNLFKKKLISLNIDLIFVISFGIKLSTFIIKKPKLGCFNIHPSLLPKWRGPSPIQNTILSGDKITGITVIKMNNIIDGGPIILKKKYNINKKENYKNLYKKLTKLGSSIFPKIIKKIYYNKINYIKQLKHKITYTKKIKKSEGKINWNNSAKYINRQIKAFYEWPKTFFYYKKYTIFIWKIKILNNNNNLKYKIGEIINYNNKNLKIQTKKNILKIVKIQLNNKNKITIKELFNSKPNFFIKGNILN